MKSGSFNLSLQGRDIVCRVQYSARKSISVKLLDGPEISISCPFFTPRAQLKLMLERKSEQLIKLLDRQQKALPPLSAEELSRLKSQARQDITRRVEQYAAILGLEYGRIAIRAQKSRWGSCSGKKNLNFNCLLMLCPEQIRDYVVVHELCHLKEMNHSKSFWALVETVLPDYREQRDWLKKHGTEIISRIR